MVMDGNVVNAMAAATNPMALATAIAMWLLQLLQQHCDSNGNHGNLLNATATEKVRAMATAITGHSNWNAVMQRDLQPECDNGNCNGKAIMAIAMQEWQCQCQWKCGNCNGRGNVVTGIALRKAKAIW